MRLNKKYLPNLGFVILLTILMASGIFINWALTPLSFEQAQKFEAKAHIFTKDGNLKNAKKYFLAAAKLKDDDISTSRRYRCAGTVSKIKEDKIRYYKLSLKYNPNNKNAKSELARYIKPEKYKNRYADGWSKGKNAQSMINSLNNKTNYTLTYFTSSPKKNEHNIKISIDGKIIKKQILQKGKKYKFDFTLNKGKHLVELFINETFNPMKLGMSKDNRDLGVHFDIQRGEK